MLHGAKGTLSGVVAQDGGCGGSIRDRGGNLSDPDGRRLRLRTLVIDDERLRWCSYNSRSGEAKKAMRQ